MAYRTTRNVGNRKNDRTGFIDFNTGERMSNQCAVKHEIRQGASLTHRAGSKLTQQAVAPFLEPLGSERRNETLFRKILPVGWLPFQPFNERAGPRQQISKGIPGFGSTFVAETKGIPSSGLRLCIDT